jgi:lipoyl(octanoyl) transferase
MRLAAGSSAAETVDTLSHQARSAKGVGACWHLDLGFRSFRESMVTQNRIVSLRKQGKIQDCLILVEHPPTITLGKAGNLHHLLVSELQLRKEGVDFVQTDRGGDITFHGPGQLVAYPIIDLKPRGRDVSIYLRQLESCIIETLQEFGIESQRIPGLTGVWVGDQKIAAIGVRTSQWVTSHGLALNVNTNLEYFSYIVPCGLKSKGVSSMHRQLRKFVALSQVKECLCRQFEKVFHTKLQAFDPGAVSIL